MLPIAIIILVAGLAYAVSIAPPARRPVVAIIFAVLAGAGYAAGYAATQKGSDQRTYYPIAGAIAGAMFGFGYVSSQRKKWDEERKKAEPR